MDLTDERQAIPTNSHVKVYYGTGSRIVRIWEGPDNYVILSTSRDVSDSLIDAAVRLTKGGGE